MSQACTSSPPVACVVSAWSAWQSTGPWSACTNGTQSRPEQRTRTIVTPPSGGGAACPALQETRTATQACTPAPTPVACVVSAWSAWQPTSAWSACVNNQQSRNERRTRTIVTPPQNGGTPCPGLDENRTATQACTSEPPPPPEVCGDGIDNDRDGQIDENCAPVGQVPSAPRRLSRWVRGSTVSFSWRAPISGGTPTGYILDAGITTGQTVFSLPVGLTSSVRVPNVGTGRYYVRVRAVNAAGSSRPSNEVVVSVGCSRQPSQPTSLTANTSGNTVTFTWVDEDGCSDTSYRVTAGSSPGTSNLAVATTDTSTLSASAPPGTYYVRVATVSPFGETAPSNEVAVTIAANDCATPAFPTGLDVQLSGRQVSMTWGPADEAAALASDETLPITYVLEVGSGSGLANIGMFLMDRATGFTTAAPPGTYFVRIRPRNTCGLGPASNEFVVRIP